ncbi:hypothetical protein Goari_019960, partial [Gossypium aridum]|nr:hypothetical protein [Gossypium aridum]
MGGFYKDLEASSSSIITRNNKGLIMGATCSWNRNIAFVEATEAMTAVQEGFIRMRDVRWVEEGPPVIQRAVVAEEPD